MKALRSFAVRASLPQTLHPLLRIAMNLRWSWDPHAVELFRWIDLDAWERAEHDPVRLLGLIGKERFDELAEDGAFMSFLAQVEEGLAAYLTEPRWFQQRKDSPMRQVAYFSPEFGVSEALPIYSGGLGVLAGDHLKAASDLGVPLIGVGLLYRHGYFRQVLNADGWQEERYPALDPHAMPLTLLTGDDGQPLKIEVDLAGARCVAQLWRADVGRVPLILMDCDVEENDIEEREVTDRLYGGGSEHRLRQEIVLGIGGVRALRTAGYDPDVFHSNEGHAGFLGIERIRELVAGEDMSFDQALEAVRVATVFTTHTPVPAGIDVYSADLMERYFDSYVKECDASFARFMALGQSTPVEDVRDATFNMAIMGIRLAGRSNAVSRLHGVVSRTMFSDLWPDIPHDESPITSVTNGVHTATWIGPEMHDVFDRRLSRGWTETGNVRWNKIDEVPDAELWRARERSRERLVYFIRERLREQLRKRGVSKTDMAWVDDVFDPGSLTIGFARRFAQYKRGTLLLTDVERFRRILLSAERPVQMVMAGKAHPLDDGGKEMIQALFHFADDAAVRARFVFLEDYDMEVARVLSQGCDVWLNNPRRPLEACGTSGMKGALNGAINCSILDGWWDECYDGNNGWAIGSIYTYPDQDHQDRVEASALYDLLEREIVPRFYDRSEGPVPRRWLERMKSSISTLGPQVTADRMQRDYVTRLYEPAAQQGAAVAADGWKRARDLDRWKKWIRTAWEDVEVADLEGDAVPAEVGESREVSATIRLGRLSPDDVAVELAHGRVGSAGEILDPEVVEMKPSEVGDGAASYRVAFTARTAGLYGYAVRVIPSNPGLTDRMDMGLMTWA